MALELEKTITLRKPVTLGDVPYTKLALREPTGGELEKATNGPGSNTNIGVNLNLISIVAKVPRMVVEGLCQRDLNEAIDFFGTFSA